MRAVKALAGTPLNINSDNAPSALCVDLDGTLLHTDLLMESALALVQKNPLYVFAMFAWLLRGKACLKREVARRIELDVTTLPYDTRLLAWIAANRGTGPVVLVTASDARLARSVADHLGIFDRVIASDGETNISGSNKARALVEAFGERGFSYAGNARVDLAVWAHAARVQVVNAGADLAAAAAKVAPVDLHLPPPRAGLRTWLKALRLHQWIKNLLIFLPVMAAHRIFIADDFARTLAAFACFGVCASGVYILNDLLDLRADRAHPRKRRRPFAAGLLPVQAGMLVAPVLTIAAFTGAWFVTPAFAAVLLGYYVLTLAYSFKLKRVAMLDVVVLAALYTVRIVAGTVAINAVPSFWLLAFSMFIFLSLAILKRYTELLAMRQDGKFGASGRGYHVEDLQLLQSLGGASGYLSVLVLALYINSTASQMLYRHSTALWLLCPVLLYWISRAWMIAHRGLMHDDPVVFAVTDRASQCLLALVAVIVAGAI
jgi:4-hydroxybenzoate polyprenyltransferase